MANGNSLASVDHVVVLMLENRSFDHMLGYLYPGNISPSGQPFEGLTGSESNPGTNGQPVPVFKIEPTTPNPYLMPGADPGEGYMATNDQLFGSNTAPVTGTAAACQSYIKNYGYTLGWESKSTGWPIVPGTVEGDIMGCYTPEVLPVLSGLAKGYAVCDQWFCSVPTETLPNRAFACAATSQGHMDDKTHTFTARDKAAPGFGDVFTLTTPRTDDVLAGVIVPVSATQSPAVGMTSHLEQVRDELIARRYPAGQPA